MNNYERIKNMTLDEMANVLVACINPYEEVTDFEYFSAVLPDVYFNKNICIKETKQWLQQETSE